MRNRVLKTLFLILLVFSFINFCYSANKLYKITKEQAIQHFLRCIDGLEEYDPNLDDRVQCVYGLVNENPDPKLVVPTLIKHLNNDSDEKVKKAIIQSIRRFDEGTETNKILLKIASEPITKELILQHKNKNDPEGNVKSTLQYAATEQLLFLNNSSAIPLATNMLVKYQDVNIFNYEIKNDKFKENVTNNLETIYNSPYTQDIGKIRIAKVLIFHQKKNLEEYTQLINKSLDSSDLQTQNEAIRFINYIKSDPDHQIIDVNKKSHFIESIKSKIKTLKKNDANKDEIRQILEK